MMLIDYIKDVRHIEEEIFDKIKASPAPIVLWGAGELSWYITSYLRYHNMEPAACVITIRLKHGSVHLGFPVYNYNAVKAEFAPQGGKYHIIVSTGPQYKDAIFSQLAAAQEKNPVWYLRGYEVCGEKITYQYFLQHLQQFEEAYSLLSDELFENGFY